MQKTVRFYDVRFIGPKTSDNGDPLDPGFWKQLCDSIVAMKADDRQFTVRGKQIYGESRTSKRPAQRYIYVGKVRDRSEWPDTLNSSTGRVAKLQPDDRAAVLLEPTYLLPFGAKNRVAVMGMSQVSPRVATIEDWITGILDLKPGSEHISLLPIMNPKVNQRLQEADGASIFQVQIDSHGEVPQGGAQVGRAARAAKEVSPETTVKLSWSLGHAKGSESTRDDLLNAARWAAAGWAKGASATLQLPEGDGTFRSEQYNLVRERFTSTAYFNVPDDQYPEEVSVLAGMNTTIEHFNREMS